MSAWQDFENDCCVYLTEKFGEYASFDVEGGSNSTKSDILVVPKRKKAFYIEAKYCPAQCGQFVLLPDITTKKFIYSSANEMDINQYSTAIVAYMNERFEKYKEAGTKGVSIEMADGKRVFADWIVSHYKHKGTAFIITNGYTILPIEEFGRYFDISATYRVKRSGSGAAGKKYFPQIRAAMNGNGNYAVDSERAEGDKLFVTSKRDIHNQRFYIEGYEFMFSKRGSEYEIRRLSNTFNANVIFSICNKSVKGMEACEFISSLV